MTCVAPDYLASILQLHRFPHPTSLLCFIMLVCFLLRTTSMLTSCCCSFCLNAFLLPAHHMLSHNLQIPDQISPSQRGFSWPPWPYSCPISSTYPLKLLLISFISVTALISVSYYTIMYFFLPYQNINSIRVRPLPCLSCHCIQESEVLLLMNIC